MVTDGLTPLGVLLFLALIGGSGAAAVAFVTALACRRRDVARIVALVEAAALGVYAALLLGTAVSSRSRGLEIGREKHICEVDCHLAYSVVGVRTQGSRYVVTVKVRFDETTISSHLSMAPLTPNSRYVAMVDGQGRRYAGSTDGLERQLVPGESYTTDLVFEPPPDAHDLQLILASGGPETPFLIGHENSFFHGKTTFRLTT